MYRLNFYRIGIFLAICWAWVIIGLIVWDVANWVHKVFG